MCYDVKTMTQKAKKYALRYGTEEDWEDLKKKLPKTYHTSGFTEPKLPVVGMQNSEKAQPMIWHPACFAKGYNTLNARDDKLLTSKFWKDDFKNRRCLVMIDGFYDFHESNGKKFPYYIQMKSGAPFMIAGLYRNANISGEMRTTFTMITTRANKEMAWIHNEPAYSAESRMMYVVPKDLDQEWLTGNWEQVHSQIQPLADNQLTYHPCHKIRGSGYKGNIENISDAVQYPEMNQQGTLF